MGRVPGRLRSAAQTIALAYCCIAGIVIRQVLLVLGITKDDAVGLALGQRHAWGRRIVVEPPVHPPMESGVPITEWSWMQAAAKIAALVSVVQRSIAFMAGVE